MIIYQLYVDKFNRTFQGLIDKLDYIASLGVDTIWLLPHYPSPMVDSGYDVSDFIQIRPELGTMYEFKELTEAAHDRGMKIITELVLNHTSTEHHWFKEARSTPNNSKRDYYIWNSNSNEMLNAVNAFPNIKLSNWVFNPFTHDYYFATFYTLQPDLNWDNPQVLEEFKKIIDFWLSLGVDGFRLDAMTHLIKRKHSLSIGLPETHNIIKELRKYIDSNYKDKVLLGEADLLNYQAKDYFGSSDECQYLFNFEGSTKLLLNVLNDDPTVLDDAVRSSMDIPEGCDWIYFLGNHDTITTQLLDKDKQEIMTKLLDPDGKFIKTHDKRIALRLGQILNGDPEKMENAFRKLFSIHGSKVIYYGDELGLKNSNAQEFLLDNRYSVRGDFDWNLARQQEADPNSILNRIRRVIKK
jgi:maltose alpha-D-glucosyltransferase / alpha-amylase